MPVCEMELCALCHSFLHFFYYMTLLSLCPINSHYSYVWWFGETDYQRLFIISWVGIWKRLNSYLPFSMDSWNNFKRYIHMKASLVAQWIKNLPAMQKTACNPGDWGSIPRSWRSPQERNGNLLQCSCLIIPWRDGAWNTQGKLQ